ncbi:NAD-dependent epimerase/dehydratase family protein [Nonlabens ponticola]|uniref:NAD-dependent epimerase/dehydratase family protein n=1 Tax=Nonlabens ponticola TaxID=2496866 RepID=A0A3S9MUP3_9FLAO|nr:NAD-dependent epimerase/dehydratase family protein [Nonlabens ponticola]AZQ42891.1 NAD-dependent epimerase/dehydratase family protein [Nonlabens ponticola]
MILVTGATGMVGGHLLYRFRESATQIKAIYRNPASIDKTRTIFNSYRKGDAALVDNFKWVPGDLLDLPSLEDAMEGIDQVYHCAAILGDASFDKMKQVNVTGTKYLVDIAIARGISKFCYVSSIATLANPVAGKSITEDDFFNPDALNTDYAISKYGGEMEVWRASQEDLDVVIVNPGVILGEGDYNNGSGKLWSASAATQPFYTSGSSGFVDVRDVAEIMQLLMNSDIKNERFTLVADNVEFKKILENISIAIHSKKPSILLTKWMLYTAWILGKIPSWLGIMKGLSRAEIITYTSNSKYDNEKVEEQLSYKFTALKNSIERVSSHFLENKE